MVYFLNNLRFSIDYYIRFQIEIEMLNQEDQTANYFYNSKPSTPLRINTSIILKISNHLEMLQISIENFWLSERNRASPEDIISFCKTNGLELDHQDCCILKGQLFSNNVVVTLENFVKCIAYWNRQGQEILKDFHLKRSQNIVSSYESKGKGRAQSGTIRPKSGMPIGNRSLSRQNSANHLKANVSYAKTLTKNNSSNYIKKFKEKEEMREKQLIENIEKNKIDEEYNMLLKMSELNTINKERQNKTAYRAFKNAQGTIKVRIFNLNKYEKEISLKEFDTIYKNFKKTIKENKDWTINPTNQSKQVDKLQTLKNKNVQKSQRQQQLKNLLVNTVNLTNLLKQQIKIFKMKGIYGCENI